MQSQSKTSISQKLLILKHALHGSPLRCLSTLITFSSFGNGSHSALSSLSVAVRLLLHIHCLQETPTSFSELQLDTAISLHCVCIILSNAGHYESAWKTRLIQRTESEELLAEVKGGRIYRGNYLTNEHFIIEDLCCNDFCHSQCVLRYTAVCAACACMCVHVCMWVCIYILPL